MSLKSIDHSTPKPADTVVIEKAEVNTEALESKLEDLSGDFHSLADILVKKEPQINIEVPEIRPNINIPELTTPVVNVSNLTTPVVKIWPLFWVMFPITALYAIDLLIRHWELIKQNLPVQY